MVAVKRELALAASRDAALVTGAPEFKAVEGVVRIRWVGA